MKSQNFPVNGWELENIIMNKVTDIQKEKQHIPSYLWFLSLNI